MKIDNPTIAIDTICEDLISYLKTIPHEEFETYPNIWCHVLEYVLERKFDEMEETYGEVMLNYITSQLQNRCEPSVINFLFLEYRNAFRDEQFDQENTDGLNTTNYQAFPTTPFHLKIAAEEVLKNFFVDDTYDYQEELIEGYKSRYFTKEDKIEHITKELIRFREARDWEQFHNAKDLALALSIESSELLEAFLWKRAEEASLEKIREELADVFSFAFLLAHKFNLDVEGIILKKLAQNNKKYPIDKSKGSSKKYNEL